MKYKLLDLFCCQGRAAWRFGSDGAGMTIPEIIQAFRADFHVSRERTELLIAEIERMEAALRYSPAVEVAKACEGIKHGMRCSPCVAAGKPCSENTQADSKEPKP